MTGDTVRICVAVICGGMLLVMAPVYLICTQFPGRTRQEHCTFTTMVCRVRQSLTSILDGSIPKTVASRVVIQSPPLQLMRESEKRIGELNTSFALGQ